MSGARGHFLVTLVSTNANMAIGFIGSLFLARLLTPHEIGVFSVAYVFSGLLKTLREMGLGTYIVQEQELTPARFRTAFGISIALALLTGTIVAALAVPAGIFFREPGITEALYVIAASFILVPFGATTMSLLRRNLRFTDIAVITTLGTLAQNVSAILLAWAGHGFMSLAWGSLIGIGTTVVAVVFYRPADLPWLPALTEWRRVLGFSSYVSGSALVTYANQSLSDLVLGRMLNMEAVALFNRGKGLADQATATLQQATHNVSLPHFSRAIREGRSPLPDFLRAATLYNALVLPLSAFMATCAEPLILLLFGDQWGASVPLLVILCAAVAVGAPATLTTQLLTAYGEVRTQLRLDTWALVIKLTLVVACAPLGLQAVAVGYGIATAIASLLRLRTTSRISGMTAHQMWGTIQPGLLPALLSAAGPLAVQAWLPLSPMPSLALAGLAAIAGFVAATLLSGNCVRDEMLRLLSSKRQ